MALYYGDAEYLTSSVVPREEDSLLESYRPVTSEFAFMGGKAFRRCCEDHVQNFENGSLYCNEYMLFTGVSVENMATVDTVRKSLPKMCCQYDSEEQVLIVKLMVGVGHESSLRKFSLIFTDKLRDLGLGDHVEYTGSGDMRRQKEADESFRPAETRPDVDAWPSLVFEVGFSKSLSQLRNDARFWLTRSDMQTNIVLILHIDKVRREIRIERWEVITTQRTQRAHRGNIQYAPTIGCGQRILLQEGHVYTGPALQLSVHKVFDVVPANLAAGDLDYSAADLEAWHLIFWSRF